MASRLIAFGMLFEGVGKVWFDEVRIAAAQ